MVRILRSYGRRGVNTLSEAISTWAPPSENNTAAYIAAVCKDCGVSPDAPIALESVMPVLVKAITQHENGEMPLTDEQITRGIALA